MKLSVRQKSGIFLDMNTSLYKISYLKNLNCYTSAGLSLRRGNKGVIKQCSHGDLNAKFLSRLLLALLRLVQS